MSLGRGHHTHRSRHRRARAYAQGPSFELAVEWTPGLYAPEVEVDARALCGGSTVRWALLGTDEQLKLRIEAFVARNR